MVGLQVLVLAILVRIQASEPNEKRLHFAVFFHLFTFYIIYNKVKMKFSIKNID